MTSILIGIPTLNGPARLQRCLDSIEDCTSWNRFPDVKLMICDDGSTDENLEANKALVHKRTVLRERAGLEMLMHLDGRKGISTSWNHLVRHKLTEVAVLVNDDIEVMPHWLDVLVYSVTKNPKLGMVALNQYVGITKGQRFAVRPDVPKHVFEPRIDYHEAHLLTGGGLLLASQGSIFAFRRALFDEVGGFDEDYRCFYEEVTFGIRLREKGYLHAMVSYPIVYHMGGATNSDKKNFDAEEEMARSRELFRKKFGGRSPDQIREELSQNDEWLRLGGVLREPLKEWNTSLIGLKD